MAVSNGKTQFKFASEPDDSLKCLICLEVAKNPWQHGKCGRLFCKECLDKIGAYQPCPNCRMEHPQYFEDNKSKREIGSLNVICDNISRGCEWEGTVEALADHMPNCDYNLVPCPNQCKGNSGTLHLIQRDLERHLNKECPNRQYECKYCGEKGMYILMILIHDDTCEKKVVPCTNPECGKMMERWRIKEHIQTDCEYGVTSCKYECIGCDVKLTRKEIKVHEEKDDKVHLHQALDTVVALQSRLQVLEERVGTYEGKQNSYRLRKEPVTFKISGFEEKRTNNKVFKFPSVYTSPHGYCMCVAVYPNGYNESKGTHVSVYAAVIRGQYDDELTWPFSGAIIIELLNQMADKEHYTMKIFMNNKTTEDYLGNPNFIPHSSLSHDSLRNTQYLKDDTLYFRVSVEMPDHKSWLECSECEGKSHHIM